MLTQWDWIVGNTLCKCSLLVLSATKMKVTKFFLFLLYLTLNPIIYDNLCVFSAHSQ